MAFGSPEGRPRLARSHIPEDTTCRLCDPPVVIANVAGYQGHMAGKHDIYFEAIPAEDKPVHWTQDRPEPTEPQELPPWARLAIVRHELYGESYAAAAEQMGKSGQTMAKYAKTEAGRKAVEQIREITDVKALTKMLIESATMDMYLDWLTAFQWAKEARDYKMVHTMVKDVGLQPILQEAKQGNAPPTTLILNLGATDLKSIEAKTAYTVVEADIVDEH